ncbi:DUF4136 domain-containing protein [Hymenobacter lutimineralis]|uniref:DUF4136 domain-containing protein n=1 Tax=Hymenobacter lutimineralis TaxID=2606448 RepID=A0A5D6V140_9BACT|nr:MULTISPECIES: DUF4136 domain-containing protein [Hymenobacter]QIX61380.1 DUF4136 domain-containing protein [Hymenobacter sp. BT18]TYZ08917.1 DUF4136 domain-containing protein [Hymenobacter lutimineralis]
MNSFSRFFSRPVALAAVGLALLLGNAGCASSSRVGVSSDFDHGINFRAYKTWAWYPQQPVDVEGGPAQGYNSFLDQRIRKAVEIEMNKKGLTLTDKKPDVYVAYSAKVEDKQRLDPAFTSPYSYRWYSYGTMPTRVNDYKAGTVIIDIVDANRKQLAWRGHGQAQVDQQSISEEEVYRIVGSVLGTYPPQDNQAQR